MELRGAASSATGPRSLGAAMADPDGVAAQHARYAAIIHEHVLQALSITLVQIELSRRLCAAGLLDDVISELDTAMAQVQVASDVLHQLMQDLSKPAPAARSA